MVSLVLIALLLASGHTGVQGQARGNTCPSNGVSDEFAFISKIAGGDDAEPGRYPWMVSLQRPQSLFHICGGILISDDIVLTAAHCVHPLQNYSERFPVLKIGGTALHDDKDAETHQACRTIVHDKYQPNVVNKGYDIALIQLKDSSRKKQCKLDSKPGVQDGTVTAIGWGVNGQNTEPQVFLKEVELDLVEQRVCKKVETLNLGKAIIDSMICAGGSGRDACRGDSGGPLIKPGDGCGENDVLVGLVSFGLPCATEVAATPGVYTRIVSFLDWIKNRGAQESNIYVFPDCSKPAPNSVAQDDMEIIDEVPPPSTTDLNPATDEGGCFYVDGIDFAKGADPINNGKEDVFETPSECCDLCKKTKGCLTWTFIRVEERFNPKGACWLRAVPVPAIRCSICTSGLVKREFLNRPEKNCKYFQGMDLSGSDLRETKATRIEDCCNKCKREKRCRSATFTTNAKRCFLKSGIGKLKVCNTCQSVIMDDRVLPTDDISVLRELLPGEERRIRNLVQTTERGPCRFTVGVDMVAQQENILVDGTTNVVNTPEDCCDQCRKLPGCKSWTMITVPTRLRPRGACYLSADVPEQTPCAGCTSGSVSGEGGSSLGQSSCSLLEAVDLEGSDILADFRTDSASACCDACVKNPDCKSWTRRVTTRRCYLKDKAAPTPRIKFDAESGVMTERATAEELAPLNPVITKN